MIKIISPILFLGSVLMIKTEVNGTLGDDQKQLKGSEASRSRSGSSWWGKLQNTTPKWAKSCGRLEQRIRQGKE